jgi:hypothetical protein
MEMYRDMRHDFDDVPLTGWPAAAVWLLLISLSVGVLLGVFFAALSLVRWVMA